MKCLVDANVSSEVTPPAPFPAVAEWLRKHESDLVVTPIVLGEIEYVSDSRNPPASGLLI